MGMADRPRAAGFVNLDVTKVTVWYGGPETDSGVAPHLNTTGFQDPQSDAHKVTANNRWTSQGQPRRELPRAGDRAPTPSTASQVIHQTFGQRPSTHRLSNDDGYLTAPIYPTNSRSSTMDQRRSPECHEWIRLIYTNR